MLLPVAPRAKWLGAALASVVSQTMSDWELVIVLDGACPENVRTIDESAVPERTLRVLKSPRPQGVAMALNWGMSKSKAPLVARLDADDLCEPTRLERQVREMGQRSDAVWVLGTAATEVDQEGRELGVRSVPVGSAAVKRALRWRNAVIHPSVIMRRDRILSLGGYNPRSERAQDYELWLRVSAVAALDNLADPLVRYRLHPSQHSRGSRLQHTDAVRAARRLGATSLGGRVAADARHFVWLGAQWVKGG